MPRTPRCRCRRNGPRHRRDGWRGRSWVWPCRRRLAANRAVRRSLLRYRGREYIPPRGNAAEVGSFGGDIALDGDVSTINVVGIARRIAADLGPAILEVVGVGVSAVVAGVEESDEAVFFVPGVLID